jgi:DNA oxidative demethylase
VTARAGFAPGAWLLPGYALDYAADLAAGLATVTAAAPLREVRTPRGQPLSVRMTNCGAVGWISDARGYRYEAMDPLTGRPWPAMPPAFVALATAAAADCGFAGFAPDACLVNRYATGTQMGMHQDRDERDADAPIVSVSLGVPATFRFGGLARTGPAVKVPLVHGDVVVWGGPARFAFHGVLRVRATEHPFAGSDRINLTFRKAL